jgi:putative flavoprotein involved in K+ transport
MVPGDGMVRETPTTLDLADAGIGTVVWATGYRPDLTWVKPPILDGEGYPIQRRGVTSERGLYVLGLDWLHTRSSGLFAGVGDDAAHLASVIAGRLRAEHPGRSAGDRRPVPRPSAGRA